MSVAENYQVVLLDIEGTTSAISFVHETLFPYARANLGAFIQKRWSDADVQADLEQVWRQAEADHAAGLTPPRIPASGSIERLQRAILDNLYWQMDHDRKTTGLKALQGKIWADAYQSGSIKGHIYDDVLPALKRWAAAGVPRYIYSSGSVHAQKLLFGHTTEGDLLSFFSGHYDTHIGAKKTSPSYTAIAADIGVSPTRILFLTDNILEARAAQAVGVQVVVSVRPGTATLPDAHGFPTVTSFEQLF